MFLYTGMICLWMTWGHEGLEYQWYMMQCTHDNALSCSVYKLMIDAPWLTMSEAYFVFCNGICSCSVFVLLYAISCYMRSLLERSIILTFHQEYSENSVESLEKHFGKECVCIFWVFSDFMFIVTSHIKQYKQSLLIKKWFILHLL